MTQILISLAILLLWALTSLLSRETQPLPPRVTRGRPGEGTSATPSRFAESEPRTARPLPGAGSGLGAATSPARGSRSSSRRGAKNRSSSAGTSPSKVAESDKARRLSSQINLSMAQAANRPLQITPLEIPLTSLSSTLTPLGTRASLEPRSSRAVGPAIDAGSVRGMLSSPAKLRDVAILTEILKPPVALRPTRRSH